jgi:hypothetical protein
VYKYVKSVVLPNTENEEKDDYLHYSSIANAHISPLLRAMVLSGCYGTMHNHGDPTSPTHAFAEEWLIAATQDKSTAFMFNIILQNLENVAGVSNTNDRSFCSCMKDFAAPLIIKHEVTQDADGAPMSVFKYDTCQQQDLQDYAYNANDVYFFGNDWTTTVTDTPNSYSASWYRDRASAFENTMQGTADAMRNRPDVMQSDVTAFFDSIVAVLQPNATLRAGSKRNTILSEHILWHEHTKYAQYPTVMKKVKRLQHLIATLFKNAQNGRDQYWQHVVGNEHLILQDEIFKSNPVYRPFTPRGMLNEMYAVFTPKFHDILPNGHNETLHTTLLNAETMLTKYVKGMSAHNKLRAPAVHANDLSTAEDRSVVPPRLSEKEYSMYLQKYHEAFKMCAHNGAPSYEIERIEVVNSRDYIHLGMLLWVLAVTVALCYGYLYNVSNGKLDADKSPIDRWIDKGRQFLDMFYIVVLLAVLAACTIRYGMVFLDQMLTDEDKHHTNLSEDLFTGTGNAHATAKMMNWLVFLIGIIGLFSLSFLSSFMCIIATAQKSHSVKPSDLIATYKAVLCQLGDNCHMCLFCAMVYQVLFDVLVIAGFANLAFGYQLQRGYASNEVLLATLLLTVTLGLLQHLSNLIRVLHVHCSCAPQFADSRITTYAGATSTQHHTALAYNRAICVVVVALGLVLYVNMGSISYSDMYNVVLFGIQHMWIFSAISFLVLCGFDIGYEVFYPVLGEDRGVSVFVKKKLYSSAVFILIGIFVLKLHEYFVLCSDAWVDPRDGTGGRDLHNSHVCTFISFDSFGYWIN